MSPPQAATGSGHCRGRPSTGLNQCPRVVERGDIFGADWRPPAGRRPIGILTREAAIVVLTAITFAPITRTIRGIRSEVEVGLRPSPALMLWGTCSRDVIAS
jgi:hypothetical protein